MRSTKSGDLFDVSDSEKIDGSNLLQMVGKSCLYVRSKATADSSMSKPINRGIYIMNFVTYKMYYVVSPVHSPNDAGTSSVSSSVSKPCVGMTTSVVTNLL